MIDSFVDSKKAPVSDLSVTPTEIDIGERLIEAIFQICNSRKVDATDLSLLFHFIEEGNHCLLEDFVYALNIISRLDKSAIAKLKKGSCLPERLFSLVMTSCVEQIDNEEFGFMEGASSKVFLLREFNKLGDFCDLEYRFLKGLETFLCEEKYKAMDKPAFELSNLVDILLFLPGKDLDFYLYRRKILDTCLESLMGYWQEVNLEKHRLAFFGSTSSPSMKNILPLFHGDLLPAKTMMDYSIFTGKESFSHSGHAIALHTLIYTILYVNNIKEISFFHGSLGIAFFYSEIFKTTGDVRFKKAFRNWLSVLKQTLCHFELDSVPFKAKIDYIIAGSFIAKQRHS